MVVSAEETWGSIGGGNVEAVAVNRARALLAEFAAEPTTFTANLSDKAPVEHGVQCCGGEVTVLLDPLPVLPAVAIFGVGHVGLELARILARHELDLHLVDSRPQQLSDVALAPLADATARIHTHHVPVLPELVLGELPAGAHVLVMTHDHAEDAALIDAALRTDHLGSIGLIGSSAKWTRFRKKLLDDGHEPAALRAGDDSDRPAGADRQGSCHHRRGGRGRTAARLRARAGRRPRPADRVDRAGRDHRRG